MSSKKSKLHIVPDKAGLTIIMLITLLAETVFMFLVMALDVLPEKYVGALVAAIICIDIISFMLMASRSEKKGKRVLGTIICILMLGLMGAGSYYLFCTYDALNTITEDKPLDRDEKGIDVTQEPFNVYISGSDSRVGIEEDARSDVNMIMTFNPETHTVLLTSMPRDSYVPLHMNGEMDKLTHTGVYGIDESIGTIEDWLQVDIDYYVKVDFNMLVNLVNAIDGIDVYSDRAFESSITDWTYKKGWNHMSGKKALYFARERKCFKKDDQQRIKNQQKVVKALIKKITKDKKLITKYPELLSIVQDDMRTSFSTDNISKLAKMQLDEMPKWKIKTQAVKGDYDMLGTWSMGPGRPLLVCVPREQSVENVTKTIQETMNPAEEE